MIQKERGFAGDFEGKAPREEKFLPRRYKKRKK
jgi:hypothetical protein